MRARTTFKYCLLITCVLGAGAAPAEVSLPNIFSDHMVLQRDHANRVWGKADSGEVVTVRVADMEKQTTANSEGTWKIKLDSLPAGGPHEMVVSGSNTITIQDILVGEVWICSGQSNMEWRVKNSDEVDLVRATATDDQIRHIGFPNVGSQTPVWSHDKHTWCRATPESVEDFTAVGYHFGKALREALGVPIGLVNDAWGGSAADAWIDRELLETDEAYRPTLERWREIENRHEALLAKAKHTEKDKKDLIQLRRQIYGNQRPGNIYNGVLASHLGYGMRGVIWYQGESNVRRAEQYRDLFPMMVEHWRDRWGIGDFPFYWVQLADFLKESPEPGNSDWAELREAQTMALDRLSNSGQAVIIDAGEGKDIHPRDKRVVGARLARLALADVYGFDLASRSPRYASMEAIDGKIVLTFQDVDGGWRPFDVKAPRGFAIADKSRRFVWAKAKILRDGRIEVWSDEVPEPVAVRYAWANNPVCNLFDGAGLPCTPFRTDDWPGVTDGRR